jgi:hypothetical protein
VSSKILYSIAFPFVLSLVFILFDVIDRVVEEVGLKAMELSSVLMSVLVALVRDGDSIVAKQCIVSGTNFFCSVLEQLALQVKHTNFLVGYPFLSPTYPNSTTYAPSVKL